MSEDPRIEVRLSKGSRTWDVLRRGETTAISTHRVKEDAVAAAMIVAKSEHAELVVRGKHGRVTEVFFSNRGRI